MGLVHWDDPEGWYGEGGGRGVQDGEHVYTHGCMAKLICRREVHDRDPKGNIILEEGVSGRNRELQ